MSESLHERCMRICGKDARSCFINDPGQLACISDMLINKAYSLSSTLEAIKAEGLQESTSKLIDDSLGITAELLNWVKYLQVTRDLQNTIHSTFETADPDNRREMRYPFPEYLNKLITLRARCDREMQEVNLLNFSSGGFQFLCNSPLDTGRSFEAELRAIQPDKTLSFGAEVKYVLEQGENFIVGAAIDEVSSSSDLNFFRGVMEFISATISRIELGDDQPD